MSNAEITQEIERIKGSFPGADENNLKVLEGLIEQAAFEKIYLRQLNEQALKSGLIEFHPDNPKLQRALPISNEIAKHSASLTNIMDKLIKHLGARSDDEDEDLDDYE
jgi:hypothetical protein